MGLLIKEFWEQYPHYSMGFTASNPKTKTEEIVGLRMHLLYNTNTKRTYQEFFIWDNYTSLLNALIDEKPHSFEMQVNNNKFNVLLKLVNSTILGVCLETKERIAFSRGVRIKID